MKGVNNMTLDHFIKAKLGNWANSQYTVCDDTTEGDPADVLKDLRRQAIYEWQEEGELQSLEDKAYSNRDRRNNKYPKFKRRG